MKGVKQVRKNKRSNGLKYSYKTIEYLDDGWVDVKKFLPYDYDLCSLNTGKKILTGWYCGNSWDGYKIKKEDEILFWKRKFDHDLDYIDLQ